MELHAKSGPIAIDDPVIRALQAKNPTKDVARELDAMALWLARHPGRRPVNIWRFIDNWLRKADAVIAPPPAQVAAYWATPERTVNQGKALELPSRPGESMEQYRQRIAARLADMRASLRQTRH